MQALSQLNSTHLTRWETGDMFFLLFLCWLTDLLKSSYLSVLRASTQ